jgi:hypothetical protein
LETFLAETRDQYEAVLAESASGQGA